MTVIVFQLNLSNNENKLQYEANARIYIFFLHCTEMHTHKFYFFVE